MYPLSKQDQFVTNLDKLRAISPEVATGFRSFRNTIESLGALDTRERELIMIAGFAATRNEPGFRVHVNRAHDAGATIEQLEQAVMILLATSLGLVPVVEALGWIHDELD